MQQDIRSRLMRKFNESARPSVCLQSVCLSVCVTWEWEQSRSIARMAFAAVIFNKRVFMLCYININLNFQIPEKSVPTRRRIRRLIAITQPCNQLNSSPPVVTAKLYYALSCAVCHKSVVAPILIYTHSPAVHCSLHCRGRKDRRAGSKSLNYDDGGLRPCGGYTAYRRYVAKRHRPIVDALLSVYSRPL